jgi:hypothetical protein
MTSTTFSIDTVTVIDHIEPYGFRQQTLSLLYRALGQGDTKVLTHECRQLFRKIRTYMREHEAATNNEMLAMLCDDISITYKNLDRPTKDMCVLGRHMSQGQQKIYTPSTVERANDAMSISPLASPCALRRQRTISSTDVSSSQIATAVMEYDPFDVFDRFDGISIGASLLRDDDSTVVDVPNLTDNMYISDDDVDAYIQSSTTTSCFKSPSATQTMRIVSETYYDGDDDNV